MIERILKYVDALAYRYELQNLGFKVEMIALDDKSEVYMIRAVREPKL